MISSSQNRMTFQRIIACRENDVFARLPQTNSLPDAYAKRRESFHPPVPPCPAAQAHFRMQGPNGQRNIDTSRVSFLDICAGEDTFKRSVSGLECTQKDSGGAEGRHRHQERFSPFFERGEGDEKIKANRLYCVRDFVDGFPPDFVRVHTRTPCTLPASGKLGCIERPSGLS